MSEYCPYTYKIAPRVKTSLVLTMPSEKERDRRWDAIRRSMSKHNFDCLLASAPNGYMPYSNNIYYISNYIPYYNLGTFVVFPLKGEPLLAVETSLGPQFLHYALETSWIRQITSSLRSIRDVMAKIKELNLDKAKIGLIGFRAGDFSAPTYNALREAFPDASLEDGKAAITEAMDEVSRTSQEELAMLRRGCQILDASFQAVAKAIKPGVKECELWAAAEAAMLNNGGWYGPSIYAASGPTPTFPRAPASQYALKKGDLIMFEINANYAGVSPQISYSISLGEPKSEIKKMYEFCKKLYDYSLVELEKKKSFMDIELGLAGMIREAGYEPMTPQIHRFNMSYAMQMQNPPRPGDYFTVHPNFCNKDFTAGAKFGDTVRIAKDGKVESLHTTPVKLNIVEA